MKVIYTLTTDIVADDENNKQTVYGITALDNSNNVLKTVGKIFLNKQKAEEFIKLCNDEGLEVIHLQDVIDDLF